MSTTFDQHQVSPSVASGITFGSSCNSYRAACHRDIATGSSSPTHAAGCRRYQNSLQRELHTKRKRKSTPTCSTCRFFNPIFLAWGEDRRDPRSSYGDAPRSNASFDAGQDQWQWGPRHAVNCPNGSFISRGTKRRFFGNGNRRL